MNMRWDSPKGKRKKGATGRNSHEVEQKEGGVLTLDETPGIEVEGLAPPFPHAQEVEQAELVTLQSLLKMVAGAGLEPAT